MLPKVPETKEEITLPWLQEALKQCPFDILNFEWNGSVGGGVGLLSSLERLSLNILDKGEVKGLSLIIKTPPTGNPGLRSFVLSEGFCQREYQMYTKVFPAWKKFQDGRNTAEKFRFRAPHCYYAAEEGSGSEYKMILIMEDMIASGFSLTSDGFRKGIRFTQAKQVVKEMAQFHAVGMAYKEHFGIKHYAGEEYDFLYTHSKNEALTDTFLESGITTTCDMLRKSGDIPSGLISDIESFRDLRKLQDLSFPRGNRAGTITHQDLHIHNLMYSQESNSVAILDFQGCSYASPMSDLSFFLLLSCDPSVYQDNLMEIISHYHATFSSCMEAMDSEVKYPIEELLEDYHASLFSSVIHIIMGAPSWCFGPFTDKETEDRYKTALVHSYQRCGYKLGLETVENFASYFEGNEE